METMLKRRIKDLSPRQQNIVNYLSTHKAMTRDELEGGLGIPHTTLYDNLNKLEKEEIVIRISKPNNNKIGRSLVYWSIKQAHNLVLFNQVHDLVLFVKQTQDLTSTKPKKNKPKLISGKLPILEKKIMLDEVKHLTYILRKLENSKLTKQKKPSNNKPTTSYILTNKDSKLTKYVLDKINKYTYFKTATIRNNYLSNSLKDKYNDIQEKIRRSVSNRIGRIVRELNELKIIVKYSGSVRSVWKNLYKDDLYNILDEKMEQNYFMLKIKK